MSANLGMNVRWSSGCLPVRQYVGAYVCKHVSVYARVYVGMFVWLTLSMVLSAEHVFSG